MNVAAFLDLAFAFQRRFRVVPAGAAELRDVCYRLRHAVYCREFGFEPAQENGRETDEWDAEGIHCLVQSVTTGQYVGCVRLIVPLSRDPCTPLPFERTCAGTIDRVIVDPQRLPRTSIAELSRLLLIPDFRRCGEDRALPHVLPERTVRTERHTVVASVLAGLSLGLVALARRHRIDTLFMLAERRLVRYFGVLTGFRPQIIGRAVEHRGLRVPAMVRVPEVLDRLNVLVQPLFTAISTDIRRTPFHAKPLEPATAAGGTVARSARAAKSGKYPSASPGALDCEPLTAA